MVMDGDDGNGDQNNNKIDEPANMTFHNCPVRRREATGRPCMARNA